MEKRPPVPIDLQRGILVEAGHRCAIRTCRQVPVEIAHIIGWAKCKEHSFQNLIALCPTCHTRYDLGEIDRKSMMIYKQKLSDSSGRYGDLEQRVLKLLSRQPQKDEVLLISDMEILLMNLLEDGLLRDTGQDLPIDNGGLVTRKSYQLTDKGKSFLGERKLLG